MCPVHNSWPHGCDVREVSQHVTASDTSQLACIKPNRCTPLRRQSCDTPVSAEVDDSLGLQSAECACRMSTDRQLCRACEATLLRVVFSACGCPANVYRPRDVLVQAWLWSAESPLRFMYNSKTINTSNTSVPHLTRAQRHPKHEMQAHQPDSKRRSAAGVCVAVAALAVLMSSSLSSSHSSWQAPHLICH